MAGLKSGLDDFAVGEKFTCAECGYIYTITKPSQQNYSFSKIVRVLCPGCGTPNQRDYGQYPKN